MVLFLPLVGVRPVQAQVDEGQLGAWYMLFWSARAGQSPLGVQGDVQFRNWDTLGDLEQLLVRAGIMLHPSSSGASFTLGAAHVTSGTFGSDASTSSEFRLYQEALFPQQVGGRAAVRHRLRTEQRWVEGQDVRTRLRYAVFIDLPLNSPRVAPGAWYLAAYDEVFINGETDVGQGQTVKRFDRNRLYGALGLMPRAGYRIQAGYMLQSTATIHKGQLQLSLHRSF
jgi:hypothetical protein